LNSRANATIPNHCNCLAFTRSACAALGSVSTLTYNATINRDGIGGYWMEYNLAFDVSLMKAGANELKLTIQPAA